MLLDAVAAITVYHPYNLKWRIRMLWYPIFLANRDPDLVRHLIGEAVPCKGWHQTNDTAWHQLSGLGKRLPGINRCIR